jgi:hypothetical protein
MMRALCTSLFVAALALAAAPASGQVNERGMAEAEALIRAAFDAVALVRTEFVGISEGSGLQAQGLRVQVEAEGAHGTVALSSETHEELARSLGVPLLSDVTVCDLPPGAHLFSGLVRSISEQGAEASVNIDSRTGSRGGIRAFRVLAVRDAERGWKVTQVDPGLSAHVVCEPAHS